jgi:hypothetical protein
MVKRAKPIPLYSALKKVERMMPLIRNDLLSALEVEAAMQSANDIVVGGDLEGEFYGAACYNTVSQTMGVYLCILIAKLFEVPGPRRGMSYTARLNEADFASIPLQVRLVSQKRIRAILASRADSMFPRGRPVSGVAREAAIAEAERLWRTTRESEASALRNVKAFRDHTLAHTLLRDRPHDIPKYEDLFRLIDAAREIFKCLSLAVAGDINDFEAAEMARYHLSAAFWRPALLAHKVASED